MQLQDLIPQREDNIEGTEKVSKAYSLAKMIKLLRIIKLI